MITDIQFLGSANGLYYGDYNDISFDSNGNINTVSGTAYARQAIVKILDTAIGTNSLFPNYGSTLSTLVGTAINDPALSANLVESITAALTYYNQTNINADVTQTISSINAINISSNQNTISVTIILTMQDGTNLTLPFTL